MWRVGHTVNIPKGYCKEQRENGGHRSLVDLPFFVVSAWWRLRQSQESTSQDHVCSSPPAMSAEESRIAVTAVFRAVAPGSTPFPGYNPFSSSPTTVLGSAKTTWLLGKRCLRDVAKDGTKISRLGGEPILTTFSHVQRGQIYLLLLRLMAKCELCSEAPSCSILTGKSDSLYHKRRLSGFKRGAMVVPPFLLSSHPYTFAEEKEDAK